MADSRTSREQLPAWPLGCGLAVLNLLLIFNLFGLLAVLGAGVGLPPWLALAVPLAAVALAPLAELGGAIWLRRRNPYAARTLAWGLGLTAAAIGAFYFFTAWLDRASGL